MTKLRLIFLPDDPHAAAPTLTVDADGRVMARAALRADEPNLPDDSRDILVVSGVEAVAHRLSLPMRDARQARGAAAILLEDSLASSRETTHLALGDADPGGERMVVAVSDARMQAWLEQAARLGVRPDAMVPTYALLPAGLDQIVVTAVLPSEVALRGPGLAAAVEPELFDALVAGRPVRVVEDAAEREAMLAVGALSPAVDLLQGAYDPKAGVALGPKDFHRAAILAVLLLASPLVLWGASIIRDRWAAASDDAKARDLADRLAPGADQGLLPMERLRRREDRLEGGQRFIGAASALFSLVEQTPGARVVSLYYGGGGQARASIAHANYSDAEAMKQQAARYGFDLNEEATSTENGRVMSDVVLEARR